MSASYNASFAGGMLFFFCALMSSLVTLASGVSKKEGPPSRLAKRAHGCGGLQRTERARPSFSN